MAERNAPLGRREDRLQRHAHRPRQSHGRASGRRLRAPAREGAACEAVAEFAMGVCRSSLSSLNTTPQPTPSPGLALWRTRTKQDKIRGREKLTSNQPVQIKPHPQARHKSHLRRQVCLQWPRHPAGNGCARSHRAHLLSALGITDGSPPHAREQHRPSCQRRKG
jgi:hypothetical protein